MSDPKTTADLDSSSAVDRAVSDKTAAPFPDKLTIRRVANGWIIQPGPGADEFTHIAATPDELAKHVSHWPKAQSLPG